MVRLARIAHDTDPAREEDEQVQITVHRGSMQLPGSQNLGV